MDSSTPLFDTTNFSQESYSRKIDKPWGYEIHWVPAELPYMGKVLHINKDSRLSLQIHDRKQESWFIIKGKARVIWENSAGQLNETVLEEGKGYSTSVGQMHRLVGITDCDIMEVSTPEIGTTWRLEDDYARPDETEEQRALERGE
jgi:mannose-6-phosphate isomerase-like protein (cupin superfamily)